MRKRRIRTRYISNAGGRDGIFFLGLRQRHFLTDNSVETGFPARQVGILVWNRGYAIIRMGTEEGIICMILMKNGSATLSLLNKVCNSI